MSDALNLVNDAISQLEAASVLFAQGATDPGLAAGPRAAIAASSLNQAADRFSQAGDVLEKIDGNVALALQARRLANDARSRAGEVTGAAFVPWPFVYAALGAITNGMRNLITDAKAFRTHVPQSLPLQPVG